MSRRIASLAALLCWTVGCRPADPKTTDDPGSSDSVDTADTADTADTGTPTNDAYAMARFTHFELDLDPADWDTLRHETRNVIDVLLGDCQAEPFGSPFTWFPAQLTIDGEPIGTIDVRKKGFFGSLDEERPSLKLDLVEFDDDLHFLGVERFTLNNAISDPALVRQCVGYQVFADAGIPASRCNFARVTVNGVDLGVYVNVEPVKEPFLDRHFGDATGDLYEGTLADFREGWTGTLERKTNEDSDDWSSIEGVVAALEGDDDALIDALAAEIDLDNWFTFWATEVVVTHLDGYAGNTNNYFIYDDPGRDRLVFMPWGIDAILLPQAWREGYPESVYASGALANRLYGHEEGQQLYLDALDAVLADVWDESVLQSRVDAMEDVLLPELGDDERVVSRQIEVVRDVIDSRRDEIGDERADGPYSWDIPMRDSFCMTDIGDVTGSFATTWGTLHTDDPFTAGEATLSLVVEDETINPDEVGVVAGTVADSGEHLLYLASWISDHEAIIVYLVAMPDAWTPGELTIDFDRATAALFYRDVDTMADFELVSYIVGTYTFDEAGTDPGDALSGTLSGDLIAL